MDIRIRRLAVGQLKCSDTERPDISLVVVARLLNNFGSHPKRRADKSVLLGHCGRELPRDTKIGQFNLAIGTE